MINYITVHALSSCLFMQLCEEMDAEHTHFLCTKMWEGFLKVDHWPEFLTYKRCSRDFWQHLSVTQKGLQTLLTCVTYSTCSMNSIYLSLWGRRTTVFKSADKVTEINAKRIMEVTSEHWGFDMFQILTEILKETEPGPSSSWLVCDHLLQLSKEFEHYFPTTKHSWTGKE